MTEKSIVSPDDQTVTFVELFFDLVFVFSVTQVVSVLTHDLSIETIARSMLVFWLIWWAWTQFTWTLNAANTDHPHIQMATLIATAIAFFMAISVPAAFGSGAFWFAIPYVLVRIVGLVVYRKVAKPYPSQAEAVRNFSLASLGGFAAVLVGAILGGEAQYWLWGMTILLDVFAARAASTSDAWNLHHEHFTERHGLIVIIAQGESLIVAAAGLVGADVSVNVLLVGFFAVLTTCALWWSYFPYIKPLMEHHLGRANESTQSSMAKDAFSLGHFPLLCGIILFATALELAVGRPENPMPAAARTTMAVGILLFILSTAYAQWRTARILPARRLVIVLIISAAVFAVSGIPPWSTIAIAFAGVAGIVAVEQTRTRTLLDAVEHQNTGPL